jgi:hypothetical protein
MFDSIFPEKPSVSSGLLTLLSLLATSTASYLADKQGNIVMSEKTLLLTAGAIFSVLIGLSSYIYLMNKKHLKTENRKQRIIFWREQLGKVDDYQAFKNSQTEIELDSLLTKQEMANKTKCLQDASVIANIGSPGLFSESPLDRLLKFYHLVILRVECEWELI